MILSVPATSMVVLLAEHAADAAAAARRLFEPNELLDPAAHDGGAEGSGVEAAPPASRLDPLGSRLAEGRITVVAGALAHAKARAALLRAAREHHALPMVIVLEPPTSASAAEGHDHVDAALDPAARQASLRTKLQQEGFRQVVLLSPADAVAEVRRAPLRCDRRDDAGPFDIIGDVHGCAYELRALLTRLGYAPDPAGVWGHPQRRRALFLGDLVDRGPDIPGVLRLAMDMVDAGRALCVPGNHEHKLARALEGRSLKRTNGLLQSLEQLDTTNPAFRARVAAFIDGLVTHYVLDGGRLVVAHAGLKAAMHNRATGAVRAFALYGATTGETDDAGLPVRLPWALDYRGAAAVVYGHTPCREPVWLHNTLCIHTGCVFGGALSALRWPERELVQVPAARQWYAPARPIA